MRISFTGDILVYECQNKLSRVKADRYDYSGYLSGVKSVFDKSDYVVGSLETPLAGKKARYTFEDTSFNTPDDVLTALRDIGVNMLTTGNNHALDRGISGLRRTIEVLNRFGFDHTGTQSSPKDARYIVENISGVRVAFLSFTYGTNSADNECVLGKGEEYLVNLTRCQDTPPPHRNWVKKNLRVVFKALPKSIKQFVRPVPKPGVIADCVKEDEIASTVNQPYLDTMFQMIGQAKQEADIVIFCLHSGGQFNKEVSGYTKWLIDQIVDAGVDAVVCNHTHTVLPIERRDNGCVVAYSLGNFSFTPGVGYYIDGVGAEYSKVLHIEVDERNKTIVSYSFDLCKTVVDQDGRAYVKLKL